MVTIDVNGFDAELGEYSANINISSNGGDETVVVNVTTTSFDPQVSLSLSELNYNTPTDITYGISQEGGELYMSSGTLTSDTGHFDFTNLDVGDIVGSGTIDFFASIIFPFKIELFFGSNFFLLSNSFFQQASIISFKCF